jgi:putative transposase
MVNNTKPQRRKSIRLQGYDYSLPGAYFVTINVHNRQKVLSSVVDDQIVLTDSGMIVTETWINLPDHYQKIEMDEFIVMPDHFHGIIVLHKNVKPNSISEIVRGFKTFSAKKINILKNNSGNCFWQRNYYEHVIRDEFDLNRIRQYIQENPLKWLNGQGDVSPMEYFKY